MSQEFQPYDNEGKNLEFSVWDYRGIQGTSAPEISLEDQFNQQCEALKQEAWDKGYADGLKQGQDEITAKKEELIKWMELIQKPVQLLDDELTQEIIQTILWLCQHCISVELSVNPEKLTALIDAIKEELPSLQGNKVLAMNPDDIAWINSQITEKEMPGLQEIICSDSALNRGDFYLKSDHTELDGRLQSRLMVLFAKFINKDNLIKLIKSSD
ncbi:MAG TPA: flagellar assembly protein FliH [Legionella sp.]|nr:flagellar assembly protein FliH [Legionella sp.]